MSQVVDLIEIDAYFGPRSRHPERTLVVEARALLLLWRVNRALRAAAADGWRPAADPDTGTLVSGSRGGAGDGGWRPSDAGTGAPFSKHKRAAAVDVYDSEGWLDRWLTAERCEAHGLYREAGVATPGWVHVQDEPPGSNRRVFLP